jgi:hypothetical protein
MTPEDLIQLIKGKVGPVAYNANKEQPRTFRNETCQKIYELWEGSEKYSRLSQRGRNDT